MTDPVVSLSSLSPLGGLVSLCLVLLGIGCGFVAAWIAFRPRHRTRELEELRARLAQAVPAEELRERYVSREQYEEVRSLVSARLAEREREIEEAQGRIAELRGEVSARLSMEIVEKNYVARSAFDEIKGELKRTQDELSSRTAEQLTASSRVAALEAEREALLQHAAQLKTESEGMVAASRDAFRALAQEIFGEKSRHFIDINKSELQTLLQPLREHLTEFREKVEATRRDEIQDIVSLKEQIGTLHQSSARLSEEANQLASALKGGSKVQGDWGEERLRQILEAEGLERYIDFDEQESYRSVDGSLLRPDVVLKMPQNRRIVIDAKVSLRAYADLFHAPEGGAERVRLAKEHLQAVWNHVAALGSKEYHKAVGVSAFEYVLLFMPIEGALSVALRESPDLFQRALKQHVLLVSPSTLLIALKVIRILWQREDQARNVEQVVRECDQLYSKFVDMVRALEGLEKGLDVAHREFALVKTRLCSDTKRGSSIIGRIERIRSLGLVQSTKEIPTAFEEWAERE